MDSQLPNADLPMEVTESGTLTDFKEVHMKKAVSLISVIPSCS